MQASIEQTKLLQILLAIYLLTKCAQGASLRINFQKCQVAGFTCILINGRQQITYTCPKPTQDVTFALWDFKAPSNIETLKIQDCNTLQLSFGCTLEGRQITTLIVSNVTNLEIIKPNHINRFTHNPNVVIFENISHLGLPEMAFSQIKSKTVKPRCANPVLDLDTIYFNRVNITTIETNALDDLKNIKNFTWNEVRVDQVQHLAAQLDLAKVSDTQGSLGGFFLITNSHIKALEHLSFKIQGQNVSITDTKIDDLAPSAINGTMERFLFKGNSVANLQAYGFSILAQNVKIIRNRFDYLRSGAFERISPGLLKDSQRNFGKLRFSYDFSHNLINFVDAGGLNPDVPAYDNVASELEMTGNEFFCSCGNLGWLLADVGHGYSTDLLKGFYEALIDPGFKNLCSFTSCQLSLQNATGLVEKGMCSDNVNAESICAIINRPVVTGTRSTTMSLQDKTTDKTNRVDELPLEDVVMEPLSSGTDYSGLSMLINRELRIILVFVILLIWLN